MVELRLTLRPFTPEDASALHTCLSNVLISKYWAGDKLHLRFTDTLAKAERLLTRYLRKCDTSLNYAVTSASDTNTIVGVAEVVYFDQAEYVAHVHYALLPDHRNADEETALIKLLMEYIHEAFGGCYVHLYRHCDDEIGMRAASLAGMYGEPFDLDIKVFCTH